MYPPSALPRTGSVTRAISSITHKIPKIGVTYVSTNVDSSGHSQMHTRNAHRQSLLNAFDTYEPTMYPSPLEYGRLDGHTIHRFCLTRRVAQQY